MNSYSSVKTTLGSSYNCVSVSLCENVSKYGVSSGPYFPAFILNMEGYCISPYSEQMGENTDQ